MNPTSPYSTAALGTAPAGRQETLHQLQATGCSPLPSSLLSPPQAGPHLPQGHRIHLKDCPAPGERLCPPSTQGLSHHLPGTCCQHGGTGPAVRLVPSLCSSRPLPDPKLLAPQHHRPQGCQRAMPEGQQHAAGAVSTSFCFSPPPKPQELLICDEFEEHKPQGVLNSLSCLRDIAFAWGHKPLSKHLYACSLRAGEQFTGTGEAETVFATG